MQRSTPVATAEFCNPARGKPKDEFGQHASGLGDVDHDGFADVIVGAPSNSAGGEKAGRAYVYSGQDGHRLLTLTGERAGDGFGSAVAGYSDRSPAPDRRSSARRAEA